MRKFALFLVLCCLTFALFTGCKAVKAGVEAYGHYRKGEVGAACKVVLAYGVDYGSRKLEAKAESVGLPTSLAQMQENVGKVIGGSTLLSRVTGALDGAIAATVAPMRPTFDRAIAQLKIPDEQAMLQSATAATDLFATQARSLLLSALKPCVQAQLAKDRLAGVSVQDAFDTLLKGWNALANSAPGRLLGFQARQCDLAEHLANTELDILFNAMRLKEKAIRLNPQEQDTELLRRVFGAR